MPPEGQKRETKISPNSNEINRILPVCFRTEHGLSDLQPVLVGPNYDDPISSFIRSSIQSLLEHIDRLNPEISKFKTHGIRRPHREVTDILERREKIIRPIEEKIKVLRGEIMGPVEIRLDVKGKPMSLRLGQFTGNQGALWRPIYEVSKKAKGNPSELELIVKENSIMRG